MHFGFGCMVRGSSVGPSPSRRAPHHDISLCHGEVHPAATEELRGASNHGSEKGLQPGEARIAGKAALLARCHQAKKPPGPTRPLSLQASGAFSLAGSKVGRSGGTCGVGWPGPRSHWPEWPTGRRSRKSHFVFGNMQRSCCFGRGGRFSRLRAGSR